MNSWIAAWLFSAILSSGAYFFTRKAELPRSLCLLFAIAVFPAPLFYVFQGYASTVYGVDAVTPFAVLRAVRCWKSSHPQLRAVAIMLGISCGVFPLLIAIVFSPVSPDILFTAINLYRLVGAMALMISMNAVSRRDPHLLHNWLNTFSWIAVVILAAMLAKLFLGFDSDVMSLVESSVVGKNYVYSKSNFNVLGMFRGEIGIFCMLAVCSFASYDFKSSKFPVLPTLGALAALIATVMSGSKTSLVVELVILSIVLMRSLSTRVGMAFLLCSVICATAAGSRWGEIREFLPNSMVAFFELGSGNNGYITLDYREEFKWKPSFEAIQRSPGLLAGLAFRDSMPQDFDDVDSTYTPSFYHNEYISVLMLGGGVSLFLYLAGIGSLLSLIVPRAYESSAGLLALWALLGGIIQGMTMVHIEPGLLFGATVCASCSIYGYACPRGIVIPKQRSFSYQSLQPRNFTNNSTTRRT